jgi:(p)ppGpp synthase/HD superfamily hydrolase
MPNIKDHFQRRSLSHGEAPDPELSSTFGDALAFAVGLHRNHARKGSRTPYSSHLLSVAALVLENGGSEKEAIAALLHDAIEDQSGTDPEPLKREIAESFGKDVLSIVLECSDADSSETKGPWKQRKTKYLEHLASASDGALLVSLSDKVHNARCILRDFRESGDALWSRFKGGREGTLWYYRGLVQAFRRRATKPLVDELDRIVSELEILTRSASQ